MSSSTQPPEFSVDLLDHPVVTLDARRLRLMLGTVVPLLVSQAVNGIGLLRIPSQIPPNALVNLTARPDAERLRVEVDLIR